MFDPQRKQFFSLTTYLTNHDTSRLCLLQFDVQAAGLPGVWDSQLLTGLRDRSWSTTVTITIYVQDRLCDELWLKKPVPTIVFYHGYGSCAAMARPYVVTFRSYGVAVVTVEAPV